jgi:RNA polymerase sigma factor (sigma-70 family)
VTVLTHGLAQRSGTRVVFVIEDAPSDQGAVSGRVDWRKASEAELGVGFVCGEEACLQEAFRRWAPLIYTIASRALDSPSDGEEITQEVYVSAWRAHANYEPEKGSLSGWLIGIARHRVADRLRARGREVRLVQAVTNYSESQVQLEAVSTLIDRFANCPLHAARSCSSPSGRVAATRRSPSSSTSRSGRSKATPGALYATYAAG